MEQPSLLDHQDSLSQLMLGGAFRFNPDLATITEGEYRDLIESVEPTSFECAYNMRNGLNIIEKLTVDYNEDNNLVELLRYERSWEELGMRVFELELVTVPRLILTTSEPEHSSTLLNTWWCLRNGSVAHFRQIFNGEVTKSIGILNH